MNNSKVRKLLRLGAALLIAWWNSTGGLRSGVLVDVFVCFGDKNKMWLCFLFFSSDLRFLAAAQGNVIYCSFPLFHVLSHTFLVAEKEVM